MKYTKIRWHQYFSQLLNETKGIKEEETSDIHSTLEYGSTTDITTKEVGEALRKMGRTKAVGPDSILIEV